MASTFSPNLKIELIASGEQSGTWGTTTNTNLGTLIEQAVAGYATQAVTDGSATVLTIPDGTSSTGRNYVIELTGALTANRTVEVPAVDKPYIFFNNTTGGFSVTVKVSGQTGVTIANGKKAIVYTNSVDVIEVVNAAVTETGTQTLTNKTLTSPTITSPTITSATIASPTVTGVATFAAGTVSAPAITTTGDTNTGVFFPAADTMAFTEGGVEALRINSDAQVVTTAGTVSLPAITTTGDTNTGIFFPAADTIAFAEGGVEAMRINSDAQIVATAGTAALPAITTTGDVNTGIFFPAADTVAISAAGTEDFRIGPAGQIGIGGANYGTSGQALISNGASAAPSWQTTPAPSALSTASGSAPSYSARAWVNFNGTGTVAIRASGNVTSITDNGTGDYTVNFTTAMSDVSYAAVATAGTATSTGRIAYTPSANYATGSVKVLTSSVGGSMNDAELVTLAVLR